MRDINWVEFSLGVVIVAFGLFCFFSQKMQKWGMEHTSQGVAWGKLVGDKRAPFVVKYVSSVALFIYAGFVFYSAIYGPSTEGSSLADH